MASMIGHDILDIGSRNADMRARRQRGGVGLPGAEMTTLGNPGQFDVPNVPDVSLDCIGFDWIGLVSPSLICV
jgi:hypothetical protein